MSNVIKIKHGTTIPKESQLQQYELGYCTENGLLYIGGSSTSSSTNAQCINYLPLSGGEVSGQIQINCSNYGGTVEESALYVPNGYVTCRWFCSTSNSTAQSMPSSPGIAVFDGGGWLYKVNQSEFSLDGFGGVLPLTKGGTGSSTLAGIHQPSGPLVDSIIWENESIDNRGKLLTTNSLVYWDGRQTYIQDETEVTKSFLQYCDLGRFGSAAVKSVSNEIKKDDLNLITSNAVYNHCKDFITDFIEKNGHGTPSLLTLYNSYIPEDSNYKNHGTTIKFQIGPDNDSNRYSSISGFSTSEQLGQTGLAFWNIGSYKNTSRNDYWYVTEQKDAVFQPYALGVKMGNWGAGTLPPEQAWTGNYIARAGQLYFQVID